MGRAGVPAAPTALKVIRGTRKDRVNLDEPQAPEPHRLSCPRWVHPTGRKLWRRVAPQLAATRVMRDWDIEGLAIMCDAYGRYVEDSIEYQRVDPETGERAHGPTINGHRGFVKNPLLTSMKEAADTYRSWAREFGMTPSARSGIKVGGEPGGKKGAERFLSG